MLRNQMNHINNKIVTNAKGNIYLIQLDQCSFFLNYALSRPLVSRTIKDRNSSDGKQLGLCLKKYSIKNISNEQIE